MMHKYSKILSAFSILVMLKLSHFSLSQPTGSVVINGLDIQKTLLEQQKQIETLRGNMLELSNRLEALVATYEQDKAKIADSSAVATFNRSTDWYCDIYEEYDQAWCDTQTASSGVYTYTVQLVSGSLSLSFGIYCDMVIDGGGWAVIQRRIAGNLNFTKSYKEYESGLGDAGSEFWLGVNTLHHKVASVPHELRIDFYEQPFNSSTPGRSRYAKYSRINVRASCSNYQLILGEYSGDAGNILSGANGSYFSTYDRDNDLNAYKNCASELGAGWWYSSTCNSQFGNLNSAMSQSSEWGVEFGADPFSIRTVEMKIRPIRQYTPTR